MTKTGTMLIFIEMLISTLVIVHPIPKKNQFWIKFPLGLVIAILLAYFLPAPANIDSTRWYHAYLREIYLVSIVYIFVYICFDIKFINISYILALSLLVNEAAHALISVCRSAKWIPNVNVLSLTPVHFFEACFMLCYYGIIFLIYFKYKGKYKLHKLGYNKLNIFVIIAFLFNNLFKRMPYMFGEYEGISVWIFQFLFVLFAILTFFFFLSFLDVKNEKEIIERMNKDSYKQFEITKSTIEAINIKCHDLKHKVYRELINDEEKKNISELINIYDKRIRTGNLALDYILMDYNLRNSDKNIEISFSGDGSSLNFVKDNDLFNFLTNALENSLEAIESLDDSKKTISLNVEPKGDLVLVTIRNYYDGKLLFENGSIKTKKEYEIGEHGYGIKSMMNVTKKYSGDINLVTNNDIFSLTAYFVNDKPRLNKEEL